MKALIDTNVVLDDALAREPFASDAREIVEACARGDYTGYVSAITPLNAFYVARRLMGTQPAREMVGRLLQLFDVCPLDRGALRAAYASGQADLEDAAQVAAAVAMGMDVIVTRDARGFTDAPLRTLTPSAFLAELRTS